MHSVPWRYHQGGTLGSGHSRGTMVGASRGLCTSRSLCLGVLWWGHSGVCVPWGTSVGTSKVCVPGGTTTGTSWGDLVGWSGNTQHGHWGYWWGRPEAGLNEWGRPSTPTLR